MFLSLVDSAQAPFSGDLRQLSIQTLCTNRDLVLQMPVGIGKSDFSLDVAAPVTSIRVVSGPSRPYAPLADGAVAWRAISHLSLNYLSLVNSDAAGRRRGAARSARAVRRRRRRERPATDRGHPVGAGAAASCAGCRSSSAGGRRARVRPRPRDHACEVDELAFEGGSAYLLGSVLDRFFARYVSINSFTETVLAVRRAGARSTDGCHNGARDRRSSVLRRAGGGAVPLRLLPDAAAARVPVRRRSRGGDRRCAQSTNRCGSGRIPDLSFAPAPLASFEAGQDGRPPRLQVRLFGLLGPNGPLPLHITEYARERLRHAGDPTLSRFLDLFHHRFLALFYRAWAQAQPHVNRDRPNDDRFAVYVGAFLGMSPAAFRDRDTLPDLAKFFHVGALIRHVRNAEGLDGHPRAASSACRCGSRSSSATGCRWATGERTYLQREGATLGSGAVLGSRVWDRQHKFRIHLGR